jgi:hypothetical protein
MSEPTSMPPVNANAIKLRGEPAAVRLRSKSLTWAPFALSTFPGSQGKAIRSAGHEVRACADLI